MTGQAPGAAYSDFGAIPILRYGMIMADPPWRFINRSSRGEAKNPSAQYRCMNLEEIADLPVSHLAAPDCLLWLWATNPMLPQALDVLRAWGFEFKTAGHWVKRTRTGKLSFGTGYVLRSAGEPFLIGAIGSPKTGARNIRSILVEAERREHSRKPEAAFRAAEALVPGVQRLELFSRSPRPGWDVFGDETGKFGEAA